MFFFAFSLCTCHWCPPFRCSPAMRSNFCRFSESAGFCRGLAAPHFFFSILFSPPDLYGTSLEWRYRPSDFPALSSASLWLFNSDFLFPLGLSGGVCFPFSTLGYSSSHSSSLYRGEVFYGRFPPEHSLLFTFSGQGMLHFRFRAPPLFSRFSFPLYFFAVMRFFFPVRLLCWASLSLSSAPTSFSWFSALFWPPGTARRRTRFL